MRKLDGAALDYAPFYCEENVWRLLARPELQEEPAWAVLVSNARREVVLLRQKAGRLGDGLIHWDYHVFAIASDPARGRLALDFDSELPFPCPLPRYLEETFPSGVQKAFAPRFRVMRGGRLPSPPCLGPLAHAEARRELARPAPALERARRGHGEIERPHGVGRRGQAQARARYSTALRMAIVRVRDGPSAEGDSMSQAISVRERVEGALLGLAAGDALGVPVEFEPRGARGRPGARHARRAGPGGSSPGTWSDDTSLALCLAESIVERGFDPEDSGRRSLAWLDEGLWTARGEAFDVGGATRRALGRIRAGMPADAGGRQGRERQRQRLPHADPARLDLALEPARKPRGCARSPPIPR